MERSLEQELAIAVLTENEKLAKVLYDRLGEKWGIGAKQLPPIHRIPVEADRLRVMIYFPATTESGEPIVINNESVNQAVRNWLTGVGPQALGLVGATRIELYELPESKVERSPPKQTLRPEHTIEWRQDGDSSGHVCYRG